MKAIRKPRNQLNKLMVSAFERVPDKTVMPEYHSEIKNPMAMDILKRKLKRKKYNSVDHFMVDVELMFENAKQYNEEDSQIYKDAVHLQKESRKVAKTEKEKPDTDYVMEEGRIPMYLARRERRTVGKRLLVLPSRADRAPFRPALLRK